MSISVQVLGPREVPLGGVRALDVRRTLPHKQRSFVGAWCFVDHYGPAPVGAGATGMDVPPHPHTGLATVSWLFEGEVEHRDSGGVVATVRPGEVNLMVAGHGICHSEVSTDATTVLHGVQLWVALPAHARDGGRAFEHHATVPIPLPRGSVSLSGESAALPTAPVPADLMALPEGSDSAGTARVFIGSLQGVASSPVPTATPLLGAQLDLAPGASVELVVEPGFEHAVLVDTGRVDLAGHWLTRAQLGIVDAGPATLRLRAGAEGARLLLLGGEPLEEEVVMWWNFMAPDHDGIVAAREAWEAHSDRFGAVHGYAGGVDRLSAPPIPPVRLRGRRRLPKVEPPAVS